MKKFKVMFFAGLMAIAGASFADGPCQVSAACQGGGLPNNPCSFSSACHGG